jgi:hypothetical protein
MNTLIDHALNGFTGNTGVMPKKGERVDLSEAWTSIVLLRCLDTDCFALPDGRTCAATGLAAMLDGMRPAGVGRHAAPSRPIWRNPPQTDDCGSGEALRAMRS